MTRAAVQRRATKRRARAGFTLIELLVAISILAMISVLIYGAFSSMRRSKESLERIQDRYREGRVALQRITRELSSAFLSTHVPPTPALIVQATAFIGTTGNPADRVDFDAFANQRRERDAHESDQAEISYFGGQNPDNSGKVDLLRRISTTLDLEPRHGGRVEVLATDIDLFDLQYLDPQSGNFVETWDSTQAIGQPNRLPLQVRVTLVLNSGARSSSDSGRDKIRLMTVVSPAIQQPLMFGGP